MTLSSGDGVIGSSEPSCVTLISIFEVPQVMTIVAERDSSESLGSRVIFQRVGACGVAVVR